MNQAVVEELYEDVKSDVEKVCSKFARKRRQNPEDIISEGNWYFVQACQRYDSSRGEFDNWVRFFVSKMLLENARKISKRNTHRRTVDMTRLPARKTFNLSLLMTDVSPDARYVMRMALTTSNNSPASIRKQIRQFLSKKGWSSERIAKAFNEVGDAL